MNSGARTLGNSLRSDAPLVDAATVTSAIAPVPTRSVADDGATTSDPVVSGPAVSTPVVSAPVVGVPAGRASKQATRGHRIKEWVVIVVAAVSVALIVRATVVQAFYIPSESMVPTLKVHDRLLVDKVSYRVHEVRRGDIVVFRRPPAETDPTVKDLIKRVIGLPGDTIEARTGAVYINDKPLPESYLPAGTITDTLPRQTVPVDQYFVMGDNRGNSSDSRVFGTISKNLIVGRAFVRFLPLSRLGTL